MHAPLANIFQPLIDIFEPVLVFLHDSVFKSWGMAIIGLTVIVRALLVPLAIKQYRSMRSLQEVAPQMKALQEKYKDDPQRKQQEMMKFYRENKINPFASCLPLLAQLPVFLALFYLLQKDLKKEICGTTRKSDTCEQVDPGSADFLFIPDLTDKAVGSVLIVLIVLYIGSQLLSSLLMSVNADRNQRMIMFGLPLVFTVFIISFPAGLIVYWITTNFWTIGQQYVVRKIVGPPAVLAGAGGPNLAASGKGGGSSGAAGDKPVTTPPPPPRKKKKRSGRRR